MSDPFSAASTAVGIISLGLQVCSGIIDYYDQWKSFHSDVKSTRDMVLHLSNTLELLQIKLKSDLLAQNPTTRQVDLIVEACEGGIHKLQKRIDKIKSTELPQPHSFNLPITKSEKLKTNLTTPATRLQLQGQRLLYPFQHGTLGKLRDTVAELRAQLEPALLLLNLDVATDTVSEVRLLRAEQHAWRAEEGNQKVLTWLSSLEFQVRQQAILAKRHLGTIDWFLKSPAFVAWSSCHAEVPPGLWCHGQMGTGKSVLAAAVIEHLQTTFSPDEAAVIYVYCDWQDSKAQDLCSLLGSLIRQCVEQCSAIPSEVRECFTRHKNGKLPLVANDIPSLIEGIYHSLNKVYIVVDGLGECAYDADTKAGASRMVALEGALDLWLSISSASRSATTQLLVTSRFGPRESDKADFNEMEIRATENDLRNVILSGLLVKDWTSPWASAELGLAVQHDQDLKDQIIQICVDHADGMFLIPQLYLAHLKSMLNRRELRKAMNEPPIDLTHSIDACLLRINNQSPSMRHLGLRALMWLCYSLRPIQLRELQHAISVELDDEDFDEDGLPAAGVLITSCAGLVTLDSGTDIVRFVNFSIKEYLSSEGGGSFHFSYSHQTITHTCATYLNFHCFDIDVQPESAPRRRRAEAPSFFTQETANALFIKYPFLQYAARYWAEHTILAPEPTVAERTCTLLSDDRKARFLFTTFYASIFGSIEICPKGVTGLHVAAFSGLADTVSMLLQRIKNEKAAWLADPIDSFGRTPLWLAAARGHTNIIDELLSNDAHVSGKGGMLVQWHESRKWWFPAWARDDDMATALEVAAEEGHFATVLRLLEAGASFECSTGVHGGPLEASVFRGKERIVEVLLAAGAPVKSTAIQASVYGGNENILRMLIEKVPEDERRLDKEHQKRVVDVPHRRPSLNFRSAGLKYSPTLKDDMLQMALYAAALANRVGIAKMLLDYGVDVNADASGFHGTALAAASAHGHVEIIRLFIEAGARVNQILPRHKFLKKSQHDIAMFSAERRITARKSFGGHGTAMQAAAFAGNIDVVRLLLSHGADVNGPPGHFGTALQAASSCGNLEIVKLLLDHNASVNTSSGLYGNPAQAAAFHGYPAILGALIDAGADVNLEGGMFGYNIVAAAASGSAECLQLLIGAQADVNVTTEAAGCALRSAAGAAGASNHKTYRRPRWARNELNELEMAITTELGDFIKFAKNPRRLPRMQSRNIFGTYAGRAAQEMFHPDVSIPVEPAESFCKDIDRTACIRLLLEHGADPKIVDDHFESPLLAGIRNGDLAVTKELVNGGANIFTVSPLGTDSHQNSANKTRVPTDCDGAFRGTLPMALSTAVMTDSIDIVEYLLSKGADVNEPGIPGGRTVLHICRSSSVMAMLIKYGAIIDIPNNWGSTALHHAAQNGSSNMVRLLTEAGADVSMCNGKGSTPLHEAMSSHLFKEEDDDRKRKMEILLSAGADPNARDSAGKTPVDLCKVRHKEVLLLLLRNGVDVSLQNRVLEDVVLDHKYGNLPADLELAQWLVDQGVNLNSGTVLDLSADEASFAAARERRDAGIISSIKLNWRTEGFNRSYSITSSSCMWREQNHCRGAKSEEWNILVRLAVEGPDDPERLRFLIRNGIDTQKFGTNALLLAVRNEHRNLANCLLDHGISVTPMAIRMALWKRVKTMITGFVRYVNGEEVDDYVLDDERLDEEIARNDVWNEIYERLNIGEEERNSRVVKITTKS